MNAPARTHQHEEPLEREVAFDGGALAVISKAEIDMQIATAHRFPRSITKFREEAEAMVTLSEEIADECIYSLSRKNSEGANSNIEGPSSRFAEVIASAWGNCRAGARVISEEGEFVTAQGAFHDLERNVAISYEVKRRITGKSGRRYSADMIGVTANAACSIALRNAILKGVPKAFWAAAYESAKKTLMGDYQSLEKRRLETMQRFKLLGVSADRVYEKLGIKGIDDLSIELVFELRTTLNAIKEGDTTPEEQFPLPQKPAERSASAGLAAAVKKYPAPGVSEVPAAPKSSPTGNEPAIPSGAPAKKTGTNEDRDAVIAKIKKAKDIDTLVDLILNAGEFDWTPADLGAINATYHECAEGLK